MGYGNGEYFNFCSLNNDIIFYNICIIKLLTMNTYRYMKASQVCIFYCTLILISYKSCQNKKTASTSYYRHKSYLSEIIIILFYTVRVFSNSALASSYCCSVIFNISQASSTVPIFFANVSILFTSISAALSSAYSFAYSLA